MHESGDGLCHLFTFAVILNGSDGTDHADRNPLVQAGWQLARALWCTQESPLEKKPMLAFFDNMSLPRTRGKGECVVRLLSDQLRQHSPE